MNHTPCRNTRGRELQGVSSGAFRKASVHVEGFVEGCGDFTDFSGERIRCRLDCETKEHFNLTLNLKVRKQTTEAIPAQQARGASLHELK